MVVVVLCGDGFGDAGAVSTIFPISGSECCMIFRLRWVIFHRWFGILALVLVEMGMVKWRIEDSGRRGIRLIKDCDVTKEFFWKDLEDCSFSGGRIQELTDDAYLRGIARKEEGLLSSSRHPAGPFLRPFLCPIWLGTDSGLDRSSKRIGKSRYSENVPTLKQQNTKKNQTCETAPTITRAATSTTKTNTTLLIF